MAPREKLLQQFRGLARERLERIARNLMTLESGANVEAGKQVLRELHGLKGEARMMGFADVNTLVHQMEELVRGTEKAGYALSAGSTDALLGTCDAVRILCGAAEHDGAPPEVAKLVSWLHQCGEAEAARARGETPSPVQRPTMHVAAPTAGEPSASGMAVPSPSSPTQAAATAATAVPAAAPAPKAGNRESGAQAGAPPSRAAEPVSSSAVRSQGEFDGMVRIDVETLDRLTSAVTSLLQIARRRELDAGWRLELARELRSIGRAAEELGQEGAALAGELGRVKDLVAQSHREAKLLANVELRDIGQLYEDVQGLRMLPLSVVFEPYQRMVRDLARELGKEVELVLQGEETRADRAVVEALRDPLVHLVRNALDHGLETRQERLVQGKAPRGRLELRASRDGENILVRVAEDGRGIDPANMRKVAVKRGVLGEAEANALSDEQAKELVFLAGFTSRDSATDISGRGVGLDAVRSRLLSLGGDVRLHSEAGKGTSFELRVPVSLTVAPLLFLQVGDARVCLTASHVHAAVRLELGMLREVAGRKSLLVGDELLPIASLQTVLGGGEVAPKEGALVLVVGGQGGRAALVVDRVLEERAQAILPLRGVLARYSQLSGATLLADGRVSFVLSAPHLVQVASGATTVRRAAAYAPEEVRRRRVMVADDSPLTRELLASLLESVSYDVLTANDGVEALALLERERVDLLVSDLEMPRMDGFELTRRVKEHPTLRTLPVVIVTTRGSEADRRRGMEAGADGYIAKGDLVRQDLVDVVARLLS